MHKYRRFVVWICLLADVFTMSTIVSAAQTQRQASASPAKTQEISDKDVASLQDQLLQLLRLSPTLAEVVAHDPTLLSNSDYVGRYNPELQRFLRQHPEIAQNPDFYLFNNLHPEHEQPAQTLERKLWPQMSGSHSSEVSRELVNDGLPFLVFVCVLGAILWLIHGIVVLLSGLVLYLALERS